jgi:hypothetical protein
MRDGSECVGALSFSPEPSRLLPTWFAKLPVLRAVGLFRQNQYPPKATAVALFRQNRVGVHGRRGWFVLPIVSGG